MPSDLDTVISIQEEAPQAITQSGVIGDSNAKEITLEQESAQLQSDDIWLARKLANA
jgi:hypothetical protein